MSTDDSRRVVWLAVLALAGIIAALVLQLYSISAQRDAWMVQQMESANYRAKIKALEKEIADVRTLCSEEIAE